MPSTQTRIVQVLTTVLALVLVGIGLWALLAPHAFYDSAATYPPYNRHLIHDIGAFALGLGACLVAGLVLRDALLAVLAGNSVAALAHFGGHLADRSMGGRASDPLTFGVLAFAFVTLTLARWRQRA
jgi:hypothetical protein